MKATKKHKKHNELKAKVILFGEILFVLFVLLCGEENHESAD
jgi:hypothetical protein